MKYEIKSNIRKISGEIDDKYLQKYKVNASEEHFFDIVYQEIGDGIVLTRLSDGTLDVSYYGYPIGKIKLQGRNHSMQILKGTYNVKSIAGTIDDFIPHITDWKKYASWVLK